MSVHMYMDIYARVYMCMYTCPYTHVCVHTNCRVPTLSSFQIACVLADAVGGPFTDVSHWGFQSAALLSTTEYIC